MAEEWGCLPSGCLMQLSIFHVCFCRYLFFDAARDWNGRIASVTEISVSPSERVPHCELRLASSLESLVSRQDSVVLSERNERSICPLVGAKINA